MLYILDKLELYISYILKRNKIIMLLWNSEDDSTGMNLCHQGVLAVAEGLLICLPIPPASILSTEANGFQGLPGETACSLQAAREKAPACFRDGCHSNSKEKP